MELKEKYDAYKKIFFEDFVSFDQRPDQVGVNIPAEKIFYGENGERSVTIGDGTINLAEFIQYEFTRELIHEKDHDYNIFVGTLKRLAERIYLRLKSLNPGVEFKFEPGFFLRDDIPAYSFEKLFHTNNVVSGYSSSVLLEGNEDPCYSPFVSQDQIWNLAPIISYFSERYEDEPLKYFLIDSLKFVVDYNHTIYNPYYSTIKHYWTYCPTFNENKVKPRDRVEDRKKHLKYDIKVKRGANNWYFAYGFRKTLEKLGIKTNKWKNFLYSIIYYVVIFFADIFRVKKDNSFYCLAVSGNVWYTSRKRFLKRVSKLFNKDTNHWNVVFLECLKQNDFSYIDQDKLKTWLEEYPIPERKGLMMLPLKFLILYNYYEFLKSM